MKLGDALPKELKNALAYSAIRECSQKGYSNSAIAVVLRKQMGLNFTSSQIANMRQVSDKVHYRAPGVRANKKIGETSWRDYLPVLKKMQALKKRGSFSQDEAFIELGDGTHPVAVCSFSDQHVGSWGTDYDLFERCTDELKETKDLYAILTGDLGQYSINLRNVLEVSDNILPPEQQTDCLEDWLNDVRDKIVAATWDNHAVERQEKFAGESSLKRSLSRRCVYFNGIGHFDIKVGDQIYHGCASHKFRGRSMLNPVHGQQRYMRFQGTDREFAMAGDSHEPGMAKYTDGAMTRVAINSGSLQLNSGYGKRYFSLTTHPVFPVLVFHPDKHLIVPFWSVAEWLKSR